MLDYQNDIKTMIIGLDGNEANVDKHVGVSVYTLNLLRYFQSHSDESQSVNVYLRSRQKTCMPEESKHFTYKIVPGPIAWSQLFLPLHLYSHRPDDIFFSPAHYTPRFSPAPRIVTIHDLSYLYYPDEFLKKDLYKLKKWTEFSLRKAVKIIAVSKTTKKDIMKFYGIPDEKISVIYNGYEKKSDDDDKTSNPEILFSDLKKYILYVGTIQPRKNLAALVSAFETFHKTNPDFKLVIVGKKGWLYEEIFKDVENRSLQNSVVFTGFLPDSMVNWLYKHAFCFVLPSLYEGFGLPVLEAMSHGCPVLASFTSSLPEIGGEACLYFDPKNPSELAEKLSMLHNSESVRADLIQKGTERIAQFSWEKCGKETLELITEIYRSHK